MPGVALLLASAARWRGSGWPRAGAGIDTEPGPPTVEERRPYPLRMTVHTGLLPAPGGELRTELLEQPVSLAGMSARRLRIDVQFERRGRRVIEPPAFTIHDPLRLVTRTVRDRGDDAELLVLPRIEPVLTPSGSGGAGAGSPGDGQSPAAALRGAAAGSAAELDLDGLRPYRTGTPASRIHWPAVARSGEMLERRLTAESDSAPLVVLDASQPPRRRRWTLRCAPRPRCACSSPAAAGWRCCCPATGDRPPLPADLAGWPAQHARLALVGPAEQRPPLARARRSGAVIWVSARARPAARPGPHHRRRRLAGHAAGRAGRRRRVRGRRLRRAPHHAAGAGRLGGGGVSALRRVARATTTSRDRSSWRCSPRLGAFAALHWAALVESPPAGRILLAVAALTAAGAVLRRPEPLAAAASRPCTPLALVAVVAGAAAALAATGLSVRLLWPLNWDELSLQLEQGLSGIQTVVWPYGGPEDDVRLAILLGAPALLALAAALAFWPVRSRITASVLRFMALVALLCLYGIPVTDHDPGEPLLRGLVLFALVAAWLWAPRMRGAGGRARPGGGGRGGPGGAAAGGAGGPRRGAGRLQRLELVRRQGGHVQLGPHLRPAGLAPRRHDAAPGASRHGRCTGRPRCWTPSTACAGCARAPTTAPARWASCPTTPTPLGPQHHASRCVRCAPTS